MTAVNIPNDIITINESTFYNCGKLTTITIPANVTSIEKDAFYGCNGLISVTISNNVTSIGASAFGKCDALTSVTLNSNELLSKNAGVSMKQIFGNQVESYIIGNDVKEIASSVFKGCTDMKSVTISNSITSIGDKAFQDCSGITSMTLPNSVTFIGSSAFAGCGGMTAVNIPNSLTSIKESTFQNCGKLTSIVIPNNVTTIENNAFSGCGSLVSVTLNSNELMSRNNGVSMNQIFGSQVESYVIGDDVKVIGPLMFNGCIGMTSITIPNSVTSIGQQAFSNCNNLTEVILPDGITNINSYVFSGCNQLTSVTLPDNITSIGESVFPSNTKLYVQKGSKTLLTLWEKRNYYESRLYKPYDKNTDIEINPPTLSILSTTQTTVSAKIDNWYDGYTYECNGAAVKKADLRYTNLPPASNQNLNLLVSKDDAHYNVSCSFTTKGLSPRIAMCSYTASSISATGAYTEDDARVVSDKISITDNGYGYYDYGYYGEPTMNGAQDGNQITLSGLNPGRSYYVQYAIEVDYGGEQTAWYYGNNNVYTQPLQFSTAQPKVVSEGNVVVSASTNLDENEENVGFEWRCIDWTDEFPSNTGTAYLYDGAIEGNIKNLNTNKLWKFRPYYLSDSGTYHYGDWMGVDPTNTSYFEPTVRTYAKINIQGNTALVKGYALSGTDDVVVKGFKYWRTRNGVHKVSTRSVSLPSDAITVEATGQQAISANLTGLDYNATYHYVAFVTTSAGETYYGEEQMFTTPLATAKYATFYDSQSAYTLPKGLTASVVTGVNNKQLTYKVIAEGGKSNNVVPKGVAVMLTSAKNDATSYTMTPTESEATYTGANLLKGSDVATTTTGSNCWHYKLSYGALDTDMSQTFGWYWGAANGGAFQIEGHKAWLAVPKNAGAAARAFSIEGEATDIVEVEKEETQEGTDMYYDMQGRPVEKPVSKGVYIYQGRKIIIK